MNKITVQDVDLQGKIVIMRADFNVPLNDELQITDDARVVAALPTIKYILENGAEKLVLMSHMGRPKGEAKDNLRLNPVAKCLEEHLGMDILKLDDCIGDEVKSAIKETDKKVILLENLRFYSEETKGDEEFAKKLADLADLYVNDAFGTAHRAHASTTIIAKYLPACVGFLIGKELDFLGKIATNPDKPFAAILGGAKVSDKILVIEKLMEKCDILVIGGGMAYTFKKALGQTIGDSLLEEDRVELAKELMEKAKSKGIKFVLPVDNICAQEFGSADTKIFEENIPDGWEGLDIGPKTLEMFKEILADAKTVLWNGPVGVFEQTPYETGTKELTLFLADLDADVVVGGGDSAAAAKKYGVVDKLAHVSTGGGASLELLEGKELPGIAIIKNK